MEAAPIRQGVVRTKVLPGRRTTESSQPSAMTDGHRKTPEMDRVRECVGGWSSVHKRPPPVAVAKMKRLIDGDERQEARSPIIQHQRPVPNDDDGEVVRASAASAVRIDTRAL
ncbi:unnamed protein product [Heligmosomoides polygyrus]|uniref:Uncharacterized protein n=1 Tax=Heligmosomoides polygyrus TaxID=6339 RepID=A0A183FKU7_HELPZ|nr:unnamed protein product [Heligmosomoides polygyrus]